MTWCMSWVPSDLEVLDALSKSRAVPTQQLATLLAPHSAIAMTLERLLVLETESCVRCWDQGQKTSNSRLMWSITPVGMQKLESLSARPGR